MVLNNPVSYSFPCAGITTYPYSSGYDQITDIKCIYRPVSGEDVTLIYGVDYTVDDPGTGAIVTTEVAYPDGTLIITRQTTIDRPTDYLAYDPAPMDQVDKDLDKITLAMQEFDSQGIVLVTPGTKNVIDGYTQSLPTEKAVHDKFDALIDDATNIASPVTLMKRSSDGTVEIESGVNTKDAVNKGQLDTAVSGAGIGSGSENYLVNPLKDGTASSWAKGSGSFVSNPTWSTAQNLYAGGAMLIAFSAGVKTANDYVDGNITEIMTSMTGKQWSLKFTMFIDSGATFAADDLVLEYFDGTVASPIGNITNITNNVFSVEFQMYSTNYIGTAAKLRIRAKTGSTTCVGNLRIADVSIAPSEFAFSAPIAGPFSYTPIFQGLGAPTGVNIKWTKRGSKVFISGSLTTGTTTAVELQIGLPPLLSTPADSPSIGVVGMFIQGSTGVAAGYVVAEPSKTYVGFSFQSASAAGMSKLNGSNLSSSTTYNFTAEVDVSQYNGPIQLASEATIYLSNTESTPNTNGVVSKSYYGIEGMAIIANAADTYFDILLLRPVGPQETVAVDVRSKIDGTWVPVEIACCSVSNGLAAQGNIGGASSSGFGFIKINNGQIRLVQYKSASAYGTAPTLSSWANLISAADGYDRVRIRIGRGGAGAEVPPKVYAEAVGRSSFSSGTALPIPFDGTGGSVPTDTHGCIMASSGRFTAKYAGKYTLTGIFWGDASLLWVYKSGLAAKRLSQEVSSNSTIAFSRTIILAVNDYIDFRAGASAVITSFEVDIMGPF